MDKPRASEKKWFEALRSFVAGTLRHGIILASTKPPVLQAESDVGQTKICFLLDLVIEKQT